MQVPLHNAIDLRAATLHPSLYVGSFFLVNGKLAVVIAGRLVGISIIIAFPARGHVRMVVVSSHCLVKREVTAELLQDRCLATNPPNKR